MKAIESFEVMESFGMKDLDSSEILDLTGGWCIKCDGFGFLNCTCKTGGYVEPCGCKSSFQYNPSPCNPKMISA